MTRGSEGKDRTVERRLIKSADTGERNVDIIRNIRDALKVIRFHIRASAAGRVLHRRERTRLGPKGREREVGFGGEGWRRTERT